MTMLQVLQRVLRKGMQTRYPVQLHNTSMKQQEQDKMHHTNLLQQIRRTIT